MPAVHEKPLELAKLAVRLLFNGIRFRYLHLTGRPGRPQAVSIEITHDCIARCVMCNIWNIPKQVPNLPIAEWLGLLASPVLADLRELDVTGGEPFLRNDLAEFFEGLCDLKQTHLKRLKAVALTTNGFLTRRVVSTVGKLVEKMASEGIELVMVCAMDAAGPLHDRIRRVDQAWQKLDETVKGLIDLRKRYANLIIGIKTTILPINVGELDRIAAYARVNGLFTIISPCIITGGRYLNTDLAGNLTFSAADKAAMVRFLRRQPSGWSYHSRSLIDFYGTGAMQKPCTCGFNYFFVRSNGELHLCPLVGRAVGNIAQQPLAEVFFSKKADRIRKQIGHFDHCRQCTEPGLERFSLPMDGFAYLALLPKYGKAAFLDFHRHMGLDKYVD